MTDKKFRFPMNLQFFAEKPKEPEEVTEETSEPETPVEEVSTQETVPEETEDTTEEPENTTNTEIDELKTLVTALAAQVTELSKPAEPVEVPTEEPEEVPETSSEVDTQLASYEEALNTVVQEKLKEIPEGIAALMPPNMTAVEKLEWVNKAANAVPAVSKPVEEKPKQVIESIGQPTPVKEEKLIDTSKMTPMQKITSALEEAFNHKK